MYNAQDVDPLFSADTLQPSHCNAQASAQTRVYSSLDYCCKLSYSRIGYNTIHVFASDQSMNSDTAFPFGDTLFLPYLLLGPGPTIHAVGDEQMLRYCSLQITVGPAHLHEDHVVSCSLSGTHGVQRVTFLCSKYCLFGCNYAFAIPWKN